MTLARRNQGLRRSFHAVLLSCLTLGLPFSAPPAAVACPFCNAAMQTLSQEIASADVAVIAELVEPMPEQPADPAGGPRHAAADPADGPRRGNAYPSTSRATISRWISEVPPKIV